VFPLEHDQPNVCGIPDGFMRTILFPVPADRLGALASLHHELADDLTIRSPGSGVVRLQNSVVNYMEGRNPEFLANEMGAVLGHMDALGTPVLAPTVRESGGDGTAAWTLRRRHYLYAGTFFLRDVECVVQRFHQAGFVGSASSAWQEQWPDAPEHCAFVMPSQLVTMATNVHWFDQNRTRRTFYPDFGGMDAVKLLLAPDDEIQRTQKIAIATSEASRLHKLISDVIANANDGQ
jgi:hypothetical protein